MNHHFHKNSFSEDLVIIGSSSTLQQSPAAAKLSRIVNNNTAKSKYKSEVHSSTSNNKKVVSSYTSNNNNNNRQFYFEDFNLFYHFIPRSSKYWQKKVIKRPPSVVSIVYEESHSRSGETGQVQKADSSSSTNHRESFFPCSSSSNSPSPEFDKAILAPIHLLKSEFGLYSTETNQRYWQLLNFPNPEATAVINGQENLSLNSNSIPVSISSRNSSPIELHVEDLTFEKNQSISWYQVPVEAEIQNRVETERTRQTCQGQKALFQEPESTKPPSTVEVLLHVKELRLEQITPGKPSPIPIQRSTKLKRNYWSTSSSKKQRPLYEN